MDKQVSNARCSEDQMTIRVMQISAYPRRYHDAFIRYNPFDATDLYYHREALEAADWDRKLEMIYAAVAASRRVRMNPLDSAMCSYPVFKNSLDAYRQEISNTWNWTVFDNLYPDQWKFISELYDNIRVMDSKMQLAGNTIAMSYLLPNVIVPIDLPHTIRMLRGKTIMGKSTELQKWWFEKITKFVMTGIAHCDQIEPIFDTLPENDWDTSDLKTIDNLIMGYTFYHQHAENQTTKEPK